MEAGTETFSLRHEVVLAVSSAHNGKHTWSRQWIRAEGQQLESTMDNWALDLHSTETQSKVVEDGAEAFFLRHEVVLAVSVVHNAGNTRGCVKHGRWHWILFNETLVVLVVSTQTLNPFYWDVWWCLHNRRHSWSRLWRHQPCLWCMIVYHPPLIPAMQASKKTKCFFEFKLDTRMCHGFDINMPLNSLKHIRLHRVHWYKSHCSAPIGKGV